MKIDVEKWISNAGSCLIAHRYEYYDVITMMHVTHEDGLVAVEAKSDILGKEYESELVLNENYELVQYHCSCHYCTSKSPCAHIGAILLKMNQLEIKQFPYHEEKNIRQEVEREKIVSHERLEASQLMEITASGRNLLEIQKKKYQEHLDSLIETERYEIEPLLTMEYNEQYSISYRIGKEKKYVIRNISDFLTRIKNNAFYSYGKQLELTHRLEAFDEFAQKQIQFMEKEEARKKEDTPSYYYYSTPSLHREIKLSQENLDDFFDIYKDKDVTNFICQDEKNKLELIWHEKEKYDELSIRTNLDDYVVGNQHLYHLYQNKREYVFSRIAMDEQGAGMRLIQELMLHPIRILKQERLDFYKYVILRLTDYFEFIDLPDFQFDPVEKIKLFGDINDEGDVAIHLEYVYGNRHVAGLDDELILTYEQDLVESYIRKYAQYIQDHVAIFDSNSEKTLSFIEDGLSFLQQYADVYVSEALKRFNERRNYKMNVGVRYESDLLTIDIQSDEIPKDEISAILSQYRRKRKFYRLKSGELIHLNAPVIEELSDMMDDLHLDMKDIENGEITLDSYRLFSLEDEANMSKNLVFDRQKSFQDALDRFKVKSMEQISIPSQYEQILRSYQKDGVKWMKLLNSYGFNGILADDMGLGKTLQVIALIEDLQAQLPCIVVAPSSLVYNWNDEVDKFSKKLKTVCVVGKQENRQALLQEKADLFITSYDYMRRDHMLYENMEFEYVILDEAQYIKNQKTQNAISVKKIKAKHKLALTGTPIENSLAELWSIFDFLMPGYLFNYHYFLNHYENDIVRNDDENKKKKLKKLVTPFILRRNKKEVLTELPDKIEKVQLIEFNEDENKLYLAHLAQVNKELNVMMGNEMMDKMKVIQMLTRLRQLCCEPRLLFDNIYQPSSKMKACLDLIINLKENNQKVLVFSQFTSVLALIERELEAYNISYYKLTGSTSKEERRELIQKFQSDATDVFLISLKAGGTGLNLTAAQAVIHFDPWWNVSAQNQATDRAYRIGQEKNVQVFKLVMKNSIEEKIMKLQEKKKDLADAFVENNEGSLSKMNKQDIMELFKM